jgi:cytochrome P450
MKPRGLDWLLKYAVTADLKNWQAFVARNLDERTRKEQALKHSGNSESSARKDFFHYLFDTRDPDTGQPGYDLSELWGECELLTIAGSDTTAIVTAAMTFYLARNPSIQAELAREILSTFSSFEEIIAGPKLQGCKYLRAFIQETLRMTPPVPAELAREVLPGGTTVERQFFPQDMKASTCLYCLSYNNDVFAEPFKFRPERFLDVTEDPLGDSKENVALAESGVCAFSTGSRGRLCWRCRLCRLYWPRWSFRSK